MANTYTVTLDMQGGSNGTETVSATFDALMPAAAPPTRTGYTFNGYYTEIDGGGTQYYTADMVSAQDWDLPEDTVLYASWTMILSTLHYDGNDHTSGTVPTDSVSPYAYGATVTVLGEGDLVRTGHKFDGWNTAADGSGSSYDPGDTFPIYADTTLYAQWVDLAKIMPFVEDFEALDLGDLDGQNGWEASGAIVQTHTVREGLQAAEIIESDGFVRRTFVDAQTNVWTDFHYQPVFFEDPPSGIDPDATAVLYFNADGHPVVYNGQEPQVIESFTVATGSWVRVTVQSDYVAKTWDLYLDGASKRTGLAFYSAETTHYEEMILTGMDSCLDDIAITLEAPGAEFNLYELIVNSGSGEYAAGTVVDIEAAAASEGQEFDSWTGDTNGVADVTSASTTLTMPAAAVEVTATYRNLVEPIDDLYEYALDNQDPSAGIEDGLLRYSHLLRNDDPSLVYQLQTRDSLLLGEWVNAGTFPAETNLTGTVFDEVSYRIEMDDPVRFFRLWIYQDKE